MRRCHSLTSLRDLIALTLCLLFLPAFLSLAQEVASDAAPDAAPLEGAAAEEAEDKIPKSVFIDEVGFGLDPFFPNSERRMAVPDEGDNGSPVVPERPSLISLLHLKGLSANSRRPFAMINNVPFSLNDERRVKLEDGTALRVRLLEIRQRSVLVSVEGQRTPVELKINVQGK